MLHLRPGTDVKRAFLATALFLAITSAAAAQQPPDPVEPAVITRNEARQATVRAVQLTEPLRIDGKLDEAVYSETQPLTDFIQTLPRNGEEPTERTEAWVMFDGSNFYVAARCWDSAPPNKWIANEMRRDANQVRQNDHFGFMIDTFHDRRNGYVFYSNPVGGRIDLSEADEGNSNSDWNPVWEVRTGRFEGGWTIEMAIPFKSIRYMSGSGQSWGIPSRNAALPPISDHARGTTSSRRGTGGGAASSSPTVSKTTGQGVTPNIGSAGYRCPAARPSSG